MLTKTRHSLWRISQSNLILQMTILEHVEKIIYKCEETRKLEKALRAIKFIILRDCRI